MEWNGKGVINPFDDDGGLVNLKKYPKLAAYLNQHKAVICNRNVAKRNSDRWYRTIDRITPSITQMPKLLIPDIKGEANIVYEEGKYYPHHNLYYITSDTWDLKALQAVLLSDITRHFITTYSTKMRGGYLRFQAQYLRRIHVPYWKDVPEKIKVRLRAAAETRDIAVCNAATFDLYKLTLEDQNILTAHVILSPRTASKSANYSAMSGTAGLKSFDMPRTNGRKRFASAIETAL